MSSVNEERNIQQKLIDEVSRVQTSNLRRVESSSGMKTIFSSADYQNTLNQPKPQFGIRRNHGHKAHHAHKTPASPGKSRVRPKHNEHKAITPDLFESNNNKVKSEVNSFIPPDDPLATSTLKPEANASNRIASREGHNKLNEAESGLQNSTTASSVENGITTTTSRPVEAVRNIADSDTTLTGTFSTGEKNHDSSSWEQNTKISDLLDLANNNGMTSKSAETETPSPDAKKQHSVGMSSAESTQSEEDEAIQKLLDIAQAQETEMKDTESKNTSLHSDRDYNISSSEMFDTDSLAEIVRRSRFESETGGVEHSRKTVKMSNRNSDGFTFDLNDIISSTPQAGSEGNSTPSDRGSVYSGTVARFEQGDRASSTQNSNRNSVQSDAAQEELILTEATHTESAEADPSNREIRSSADREIELRESPYTEKGVLVSHDSDISQEDQETDRKRTIAVTPEDNVVNTSGDFDPDVPSQVEIDETHRRFDQMLADLSASFEEDFTTSEKSVGRQLSSEAEVIVHSYASEADAAQEFTDLESSIISVPEEAVVSDAVSETVGNAEQDVRRPSTASRSSSSHSNSRGADISDGSIKHTSVPRGTSGNFESQHTNGMDNDNELTRKVSNSSSAQQDASQEFMDLETSQHHVDQNGTFGTKTGPLVNTDAKQPLGWPRSNTEQDVEHNFSELNSSFHTQMGKMDDKVVYSEIPSRSRDNSPRNGQGEAVNVSVVTGEYSEAYQTRPSVGIPRDNASDNSPLYESISDGTNSFSDVRDNIFENVPSGNKTKASGRLSPLGAEVSSADGKSSWNRETYTVGSGNTVLRAISSQTTDTTEGRMATRTVPYGSEKVADSSFLPRTPRPFGFNKNKSEFQVLSENVNVKGLAKQLEKSLDFSKMFRPEGNSADDKRPDKETNISPSKKLQAKNEDPKDAFGKVLSEIFQRNKLRSVGDEYEHAEIKENKTSSNKQFLENNHEIQVDSGGEIPVKASERTDEVSAQNAGSVSEASNGFKLSEKISVERFLAESTSQTETSRQYDSEDQSPLDESSASESHSQRNSVRKAHSSSDVSMTGKRSVTRSPHEFVAEKRSVGGSPRESVNQEVYVADILYNSRDVNSSPHLSMRKHESYSSDKSLNQEDLNVVNSVYENKAGISSSQESTSVHEWVNYRKNKENLAGNLPWERNGSVSDRSERSPQERPFSKMTTAVGTDTTDSFHRSIERKVSVESLSSDNTEIITETTEQVFPRSVDRKVSVESLSSDNTEIITETTEQILPRSVDRKASVESLSSDNTEIITETTEQVFPRSIERKVSVESLSSDNTEIITETTEQVLPRSVDRKASVESLSSDNTEIITETTEQVLPRSVDRKVSVESLSSDNTEIITETTEQVFPRSVDRKVSVESLSSDNTEIITETTEQVFPRSVDRKVSVESLSSDNTEIITETTEQVFPISVDRKASVESLSSDNTEIITEATEQVFPRSVDRKVSVESLSSDNTEIITETTEQVFPRSMERKVSVESLSSEATDVVTETVEQVSYRIDAENRNSLKTYVTDGNYNKNRDSDEETVTYETEEILLPRKYGKEGIKRQDISDSDSEFTKRKTSHLYTSGEVQTGERSSRGYSRQDSQSNNNNRSSRHLESFHSSDRQISLIRNDSGEPTVTSTRIGTTKPNQVWGFDTGFNGSRRDQAFASFRHSNASDSDLEESLGSITTLQDNENLSDLSNLDDTLGSRTEEKASGEQSGYLRDYTSQRDISRNTSLSEDTYTSVHEEFYVPIPQQQTEITREQSKGHAQTDSFPSYKERFFGRSTGEAGGSVVTQSESSAHTFLHASGTENISETRDGFTERHASVNGVEQASRENDSVLLWSSLFSQPDTVQGRSVRQANSVEQPDNRVFTSPSGYGEKPAEQLRENNINIAKKGDTWGNHVTFSSLNQPVYGVRVDSDSDVTAQADLGEEFDQGREKLSRDTFSANLTSESLSGKYQKSLNGGNHSLFYDGSDDTAQVKGARGLGANGSKDRHRSGQKYQRGSMAYLLTGKEHKSGDVNRSGRSTPQRKDLYVEEDIEMSHGGMDERRGSHSSRDYLSENHGGQDFFHFDMKSPSNNHREANEGRGERIQHIERTETRTVNAASDQVEVLPDTYIGSSIPPDLPDSYIGKSKSPTSIPIHIKSNGRTADEVSLDSSRVSMHENKTSSNHHPYDKKAGKGSRDKKSEHRRTEHTTNTYMSTQNHNGDTRNHGIPFERSGHPNHTKVIHVETNSTGLHSGRRERRDVDLMSKHVLGKPSGDDNISISSLSSQSSSSFAEAGNSFDSPVSRTHNRTEKRGLHAEESRREQTVSVDRMPGNRQPAQQASMPKHAKKTHYYNSNVEPDFSDRDQRSAKDVQYLIKSLENDTKHPRRPIPGVDRDAFSYHVTSTSNENKSSSRNNQANEVDVTTREAMRDRTNKPVPGTSHVIRQYKEERIVEDVQGPSSVHLTPERADSGRRTILLQNGQPHNKAIKIHASSLERSDSDRTPTFEDSKRHKKKGHLPSGETKLYVDSSGAPHHKVKSEKVRVVKEKTYNKGHSVSSDDYSSDEEGARRRKPETGKVSTVLYDFSSKQHPSLSNVVHLEGARGLKSKDSVNSQDIYSTPRNTEKPYRARSSSESSLSDQDQRKGTVINKAKPQELWLTQDLNRHQPRKYKSENVFYEHYNVKRENPMYVEGDKVVYVSPHTKHGTRSPTREIYVDTKSHPTHHKHQLSSSFSSISPAGSPTPEDRHVTTVSFDESFNRKRSGSPIIENNVYKPKVHVKKHRVVKTDQQIIRPAESDNELYVRGSRSSPYRVVVKGDRQRSGRSSDTDDSFYSDTRTSGSHRSTINISRGSDRRPDPNAPAVMSIPLSNHPVAMTIPGVQETKYVTNKSERMELRRSASLDSIRDMVDYPTDLKNSFRSEKVLHLGNSSDGPSSPEMRSPSSPYVSTITILNRKLNVKDPNVDSGNGTEIISSDDDIRYRSQLNPVKEEVVYATKEVPRSETRRSEKHTTYTTYEEYRDSNDSYEYVTPSQQKVKTIRHERQIPIREERIRPVREDRAKAVRESLHEKFSNMSYEQSQEPQQVEQKSTSDLKVVRGQFVIRNSMDIDLDEGDSLGVDDNINIFDNSFTMNKENPLYQSDPDIYNKFESETVEERKIRIKDPGLSENGVELPWDELDVPRRQKRHAGSGSDRKTLSSVHLEYDRHDLDLPYAEGDFGDGFEDIIQNTRQAALKSAPNKKKQNLSQMLLSKLAQIDSKDITQHIDVQHNNEEIYGDIKFIHADGSKSEAMDTTNFDSVSEHIDLMLKEGKALITIKVTAERIIPIDFEFNVWRKSQAIVTRNIEIDLKANDQRRRLYEHVMETTPRKMIGSGSSSYRQSDEAVLSSKDTLKLFTRLLSVADKDEKAIERDEVRYETKHRERSDSLPSLSNADMLY